MSPPLLKDVSTRDRRHRIANTTKGTVLAETSRRATTRIGRGIGLIGRRSLPVGGGLIIEPCNSVVSFFMRFPIDVLFIDDLGRVCHLKQNMVPWRVSKIVRQSKFVIELPAGSATSTRTELGDKISIEPAA